MKQRRVMAVLGLLTQAPGGWDRGRRRGDLIMGFARTSRQ